LIKREMAQANKYRVGGRGGGATDDEMQIDDMSRERQVSKRKLKSKTSS